MTNNVQNRMVSEIELENVYGGGFGEDLKKCGDFVGKVATDTLKNILTGGIPLFIRLFNEIKKA